MIKTILEKFNIKNPDKISQCINQEDGSTYNVWEIDYEGKKYILKQTKGLEKEIYEKISPRAGIPEYFGSTILEDKEYLLIEYISGCDLCKCKREQLIKVLDALINIQNIYWDKDDKIGYAFNEGYQSCQKRKEYLKDSLIEQAYERFLAVYSKIPRTLCHNDLLPFNVIINDKAYIIDWEQAGILPYALPIVRLIAHGQSDENALFYMSDDDKKFAIEYYYCNFIKSKNIDYLEYLKTINYFLLYEYTEWIMLGNKYEDADKERFIYYKTLAINHILENKL